MFWQLDPLFFLEFKILSLVVFLFRRSLAASFDFSIIILSKEFSILTIQLSKLESLLLWLFLTLVWGFSRTVGGLIGLVSNISKSWLLVLLSSKLTPVNDFYILNYSLLTSIASACNNVICLCFSCPFFCITFYHVRYELTYNISFEEMHGWHMQVLDRILLPLLVNSKALCISADLRIWLQGDRWMLHICK